MQLEKQIAVEAALVGMLSLLLHCPQQIQDFRPHPIRNQAATYPRRHMRMEKQIAVAQALVGMLSLLLYCLQRVQEYCLHQVQTQDAIFRYCHMQLDYPGSMVTGLAPAWVEAVRQ